jgi:hypothetical protein
MTVEFSQISNLHKLPSLATAKNASPSARGKVIDVKNNERMAGKWGQEDGRQEDFLQIFLPCIFLPLLADRVAT